MLAKSVKDRQSVGARKLRKGAAVCREENVVKLDEGMSLPGRSERGFEVVRTTHANAFDLNPQ